MKKVQIQEIISLSSLIMIDPEYTTFITYIRAGEYTEARLFLDKLMSKLHQLLQADNDDQQILIQYQRCDQLENLVLNLIIGDDIEDESTNKNTRRNIIR